MINIKTKPSTILIAQGLNQGLLHWVQNGTISIKRSWASSSEEEYQMAQLTSQLFLKCPN